MFSYFQFWEELFKQIKYKMSQIYRAIELANNKGRYQLIMYALCLLAYFELGLMLLGSSFIFMNPTFNCPGMESPNEDDACPIIEQCTMLNQFTITSHANLICDRKIYRNLIQSSMYIGSILGLLVLKPFSQKLGRKYMMVVSQGILISGLTLIITGSYTKTVALMVIGQICLGAGCYSVMISVFVLITDFLEVKFKQKCLVILNAVWALSEIVISGFYFWFNMWYNYLIVILLIPNIAIMIFSVFFLVQSPYFYIQNKGDVQGAIASLQRISKINKCGADKLIQMQQLFKEALADIQQRQRNSGQKVSRFAVFKHFKYLKVLLMIATLEIGANAFYYGGQFSLGQIGTNFGYNILLTGCIESVAFFSSGFFITKVPRKLGMLIFNILSIVVGMMFFIPLSQVAQTVLLCGCRFFNSYFMAILPQITNQSFPQRYKSTSWGYIEGISQIGNFITPFIVTAAHNAGINPMIVLSFMLAVLGTFPLLFLRETLVITEDQHEEDQLKMSLMTDSTLSNNQDDSSTLS